MQQSQRDINFRLVQEIYRTVGFFESTPPFGASIPLWCAVSQDGGAVKDQILHEMVA
jgi:hypothetical protein